MLSRHTQSLRGPLNRIKKSDAAKLAFFLIVRTQIFRKVAVCWRFFPEIRMDFYGLFAKIHSVRLLPLLNTREKNVFLPLVNLKDIGR